MRRTRVLITDVSHAPEELYDQVPFVVDLIRQLPGTDRPDYWLGSVVLPLEWWVDGEKREVTHVVIAARQEGQRIEAGVRDLVAGIAFVTDLSLMVDRELDIAKCVYVAVGTCRDMSTVIE